MVVTSEPPAISRSVGELECLVRSGPGPVCADAQTRRGGTDGVWKDEWNPDLTTIKDRFGRGAGEDGEVP